MKRRPPWILLALIGLMWVAGLDGCSCNGTIVLIAVTSGSGQNATIETQFAELLVATVTTNGNPTTGASVTFTAPANGASGTFAGGATTATVTTGANGEATSPAFSANSKAGAYAVAATVLSAAAPADFNLTNLV